MKKALGIIGHNQWKQYLPKEKETESTFKAMMAENFTS